MAVPQFSGDTPSRYRSEFLRYLQPVIDALRDKGGEARPREVYDLIAERYKVTEEERAVPLSTGGSRFENQIAWARSYLYQTGFLDSPRHGIWRLTDKGKVARLTGREIDQIFLDVQKIKRLKAAATDSSDDSSTGPAGTEAEEPIAPSPDTSPYSDHRPGLIALISKMTPKGFESFCADLLARVDVEDVLTTPYSRDGGIDGVGRLRINEFVTMPIAFQAKKYDGSGKKVSSDEIQKFRGAMDNNIMKGIFFTTTTFSEEAKLEARRPGKIEVELADLDRIIEICERHQIGLSEQHILVPEAVILRALLTIGASGSGPHSGFKLEQAKSAFHNPTPSPASASPRSAPPPQPRAPAPSLC